MPLSCVTDWDSMPWLSTPPQSGRSAALANAALVYAWNECSEGFGALVPSYDAERREGDPSRLEAVASVLMRP